MASRPPSSTQLRRTVLTLLRGPERNRYANFAALSAAASIADWQRRAFYVLALIIAFDVMQDAWRISNTTDELQPLWPVFWLRWVPAETAARIVGVVVPLSVLAAVVLDRSWWPRLFVFVSLLQYAGLANSFGTINHWFHYPLWISFSLLLWPGVGPSAGSRGPSHAMRWLLPAVSAQAMIGLFYTLSGLYKAKNGIIVGEEKVSSFYPDALPLLIMGRWEQTNESPLLREFFVENLWIAWPAYLVVIYVEIFFLLAVFRPQLHRLFGGIMAAFHFGVYMFMGISFAYQPAMVALLFLWSPFAGDSVSNVRRTVAQLPGIDVIVWVWRLMRQRRRVALRPSGESASG